MFFLLCCVLFAPVLYAADSPVIGILTEETYLVRKYFPADVHYDGYIAASYVKFIESSGAKVMPVWIGQNKTYYSWVVNSTNGLLFPGGGTYFDEPKGYAEAATYLYELAKDANDAGDYYPILGICLGMEVIPFAAIGGSNINVRVNCSASRISLPLEFEPDYHKSKLFSPASPHIRRILKSMNVTFNQHKYCITKDSLQQLDISDDWEILSTNKDKNNLEFISSMEHKTYPFYGIQFHPEKNNFEFSARLHTPKSLEATEVSQYFGNFFVNECRKSEHTFIGDKEEDHLIYKYCPVYVGNQEKATFEQLYMFTFS